MKISDLSKINIKDIDLAKIQENLLQKPDLLIQLIITGISFFILIKVVAGGLLEEKKVQEKIQELGKKVARIKAHDDLQKEYSQFLADLPPGLPTDDLMGRVTELAGEHSIQISNFSPPKEIKKKFHTLTILSLNVTANNYQDMVTFIRSIEESSENLRVDRWTSAAKAQTTNSGEAASAEEDKESVSAQIDIDLVKYSKE